MKYSNTLWRLTKFTLLQICRNLRILNNIKKTVLKVSDFLFQVVQCCGDPCFWSRPSDRQYLWKLSNSIWNLTGNNSGIFLQFYDIRFPN